MNFIFTHCIVFFFAISFPLSFGEKDTIRRIEREAKLQDYYVKYDFIYFCMCILHLVITITLGVSNNSNRFLKKWNISKLQKTHTLPEFLTFNSYNSQVTFMTNGLNFCSILGGRTMLSYKHKCMISHNMGICKNPLSGDDKSYIINRKVFLSSGEKKKVTPEANDCWILFFLPSFRFQNASELKHLIWTCRDLQVTKNT